VKILIAGGTGLIGSRLADVLIKEGHNVQILSRNEGSEKLVHWNPEMGQIDADRIFDTEILINLCGAGVADKRWTKARKNVLLDSRIDPTNFLFKHRSYMPKLKHYIAASGISSYGFKRKEEPYSEDDAYGSDFLSQLVKQWEAAADAFSDIAVLTKLRISMVLTDDGGGLNKMIQPIKLGIGAPLASGDQMLQWIHMDDLTKMFVHVIDKQLDGTFNAIAGNATNADMMNTLAKRMDKKLRLPNVPPFVLKLLFGQLSEVLINGVEVSGQKMLNTGFDFRYTDLEKALSSFQLK